MKVNKQIFFATAVLLTAFTGAGRPALAGDTATVTISGLVKNPTCTLSQTEIPVSMPDVNVTDFTGKSGIEVGSKEVPFLLTNCTDITTLGIKVSGDGSGTVFSNATGSGYATGVGIVLYDTDGYKFQTNGTSKSQAQTLSDGGYKFSYTAKYISTSDTITGGNVLTVIKVVFSYA